MTRRLLVLNGLAIFMVPLYHAAAFGLSAMFDWTDRYLPVSVPNYDQLGSLWYYLLIFGREVEKWAVPAFLFISGFFVAFMARGNEHKITWQMILPRVRALLLPFILWTAFRFVLLLRPPATLSEALGTYWFITLLIQGYLLAPFLVSLAREHWKLLLFGAAFLQVGAQMLRYLLFLGVESPVIDLLVDLTPMWFIPFQILNFSIGIVAGVHLTSFKDWLARNRRTILAIVAGSVLLSIVEYQVIDQFTGPEWIGAQFNGIFGTVYTSLFSLAFLAFPEFKLPYNKFWSELGSRSLGIYLGNIPAIYVVAVILYDFAPWALGNQLVYQALLILAGLGIPLLLMEIMKRPRTRWAYRYVFG